MNFKNYPLHKACCKEMSLREFMNYVFFDKNHLIATDAHVLVALPIDAEGLNGYGIHHKDYALIYRAQHIELKEIDSQKWLIADGRIMVRLKELTDLPDWEHLFNNEPKDVDSIRIDSNLIKIITDIVGCRPLDFNFTGKNKGIIVENDDIDLRIVVMPMLVV